MTRSPLSFRARLLRLGRSHSFADGGQEPVVKTVAGPANPALPLDAAIQEAIASLDPAEGGVVRIAPGIHRIDSVDLSRNARPVVLDVRGATLVKLPPREGGTVDHMFHDRSGTARLSVLGGDLDLSGQDFTPGDTVSAFHGVRVDDWSFDAITVRNGVEEGLKLYSPRNLRVTGSTFRNIRNDGIQVHCLAADGHTGSVPERGARNVRILHCNFEGIDDGLRGTRNGQGVTFNSSYTVARGGHTVQDVRVAHNRFRDCLRGIWSEFNMPHVRGRGFRFHHNLVERSHWFGIGLVGVESASCLGNVVLDTGVQDPSPPHTSSETVGILLSGANGTNDPVDVWVDANRIEDRRSPGHMQYGLWIKSGRRLRIGTGNVVRGALLEDVRR